MEGFFLFLGGLALILIAILVVLYVLESLFSYKLAKLEGLDKPWISWIPFISPYNLFEMIKGDTFCFSTFFSLEKQTAMILYLLFPVLTGIVGNWSSVLGQLLSLTFWLFSFFLYQNLLESLENKNVLLYSILSAIGFFPIIIILIYSERMKFKEGFKKVTEGENL